MNHEDVGRLWEGNAETWTALARAGYDVYRDALNTPAFFAMLPEVGGLEGLDIGCGEGHNTRLVARRGARVIGIDISNTFVRHASEEEAREPLGIEYVQGSGLELPFAAGRFDFATAFMSLMDMPEPGRVLAETWRVLRPGGFLQFSILHPCFMTPHHRNLRGADRRTYAFEVGDYFRRTNGEVESWIFSTTPETERQRYPKFQVPRFTRPLGEWINLLVAAGFAIERVEEPRPDDETVARVPEVQDAQVVAYFLHVRVRKPAGARRES
ncbi:class I SAM-dependent methyltransferase [Opitutales bacterium ASA1]|uniref:class I SAM-dependent methyltransferase n=1 Tax=Congregicoccus parvus TaxID=3081749 RepID=UPI002B2A2567|nr:class I SAM-dependent methyltransferase [Opitutales bacterium ASA1]